MASEPSSLRYWQEQLVQQLKTGRLRYLQRISVVCAALDPTPTSLSPPPTSLQEDVPTEQRLYIENPFLHPNLHRCVVCIKRKSLTLKRILAGNLFSFTLSNMILMFATALASGDLSSILEKEISTDVPILPFLLSCLYMHIVQVKGEAAVEIEQVLRTVIQYFHSSFLFILLITMSRLHN